MRNCAEYMGASRIRMRNSSWVNDLLMTQCLKIVVVSIRTKFKNTFDKCLPLYLFDITSRRKHFFFSLDSMDAVMKTLLDDAKRKKGHEEYEPTHLVFALTQRVFEINLQKKRRKTFFKLTLKTNFINGTSKTSVLYSLVHVSGHF